MAGSNQIAPPPVPPTAQELSSLPTTPRPLFGGAITCTLPTAFVDVSRFREVPDNQEVFADAATDSAIIVELLEQSDVAASDARSAAGWHWHNLADDSGVTARTLVWAGTLDTAAAAARAPAMNGSGGKISIAGGLHVVSKFRDAESLASSVRVHLACVELSRARTHLLLSTAVPESLHPSGASARAGSVAAVSPSSPESAGALPFYAALRSLSVVDWSLFGPSAE